MGQTLEEQPLPELPPKPNKYAPKERIGAKKPISAPGKKVTRVGLGNLVVEHTNPQEYKAH